ncbi:MAG: M20/M25/M40 family metallo-hydrolase [Bacteroidales bacterium]|nr:M20/M25/M40 family metallo-hydrolase [Bacteroidales bacterium]
MKKQIFIALLLLAGLTASAQAPHLYEHDYPVIVEEDPEIRALMDSVSIDSIRATIEHLCSYHTRRYDSRFIYEVQDWLYDRYNTLPIDTVVKHDFKLHNLSITETGDNILAIQWGTKHPEEYVICGAHYDSYAWDGYDPDTIRSPGADDNATGVAGIWETARLLSHYTFDRTIIYANWCAEECGLVGSAAYAADCAAQNMDIVGYFNLDMTGYLEEGSDIHVHLMYTTQDSTIANYVFNFSHVYFPEMPIRQNWLSWGDSDYSSFNRNGYPAVHPFEDVHASSPYIHSNQDILGLSVNNLDQSKRFTELNLGLVATLAGLNHDGIVETEAVNVALYPNPAQESVTILADDDILNVSVYNLLGQQIEQRALNGSKQCLLNTSSLASGVYVVKIKTENGWVAKRLTIN